jgi:excisionase family DNA binding protein
MPVYITIGEAAHLMRYDERTIRRKVAQGLLDAVGRGRGRRIVYQSLLSFREREAEHGTS